jgi:hypothetical protein
MDIDVHFFDVYDLNWFYYTCQACQLLREVALKRRIQQHPDRELRPIHKKIVRNL